jgi:hypothetical protein
MMASLARAGVMAVVRRQNEMALFRDGQVCHFCQSPMTGDQDLLGFTFVASGNPIIRPLDDSVCHRQCLSESSDRDKFVRAWNREVMYSLGTSWFLDVAADGNVSYLSGLDRLLYGLRIKRSRYLPARISRRRPLVTMYLYHGCQTPFTLKYSYSFAHSFPTLRKLGISSELSGMIDSWVADYLSLCENERADDLNMDTRWKANSTRGHEIWCKVCDEIGERYRIVYLDAGQIWEPEDRDVPRDAPQSRNEAF